MRCILASFSLLRVPWFGRRPLLSLARCRLALGAGRILGLGLSSLGILPLTAAVYPPGLTLWLALVALLILRIWISLLILGVPTARITLLTWLSWLILFSRLILRVLAARIPLLVLLALLPLLPLLALLVLLTLAIATRLPVLGLIAFLGIGL